jgi:hypothetical protein
MPKRRKKNITHVYTTTRVEETKAVYRVCNYFVLLTLLIIDAKFSIHIPETAYILVLGSILGVDIPALTRKFLKRF